MTEPSTAPRPDGDAPGPGPDFTALPVARVRRRRMLSIVWLIPLVAAVAAAWMAFDALKSQGTLITITMENAEGIVPGKTMIKFKDVEVGQVESVRFADDLEHVVVTARMVDNMERYLREETQFWMVRARITPSEVSGLNTLFSGAYIGVWPSKRGKLTTEFTALRTPPVITDDANGSHFLLRTQSLGSLDIGSPVYFRKIKVGQVVGYELKKNDQVEIKVFVQAPHHERVRRNTRFWNASGLDLRVDARGVRMQTESLVSLLLGGVAFDSPGADEVAEPAPPGALFTLHPSRERGFERVFDYRERYVLHFDESVRGLGLGAPVEFRGMLIGHVVDMRLEMDTKRRTASIPVTIEIEPERFTLRDRNGARDTLVRTLVEMGMRAQLKPGNLLTGQTYVDLDLYPGMPPARIKESGPLPELPTAPSPLGGLLASAQRVMARLEEVPMGDISQELRSTMGSIRTTLEQMRQLMGTVRDLDILPGISRTLEQATGTLREAEAAMAPDAALRTDLRKLLRELGDAARSLRVLSETLERQPDVLLYGKEAP